MPETDSPHTEKPHTAEPCSEIPHTENPETAKPYTGKPNMENPSLSNNNLTKNQSRNIQLNNTDFSNNKPTQAPPAAPTTAQGNGEAAGAGDKIQYAEFVRMTNNEYSLLIEKIGVDGALWCIEKLDNYKGSTGKTYDSDYRTILSWVVGRYREHLQSQASQRNSTARGYVFGDVINDTSKSGDAFEDFMHKKLKEAQRYDLQ